MSDPDLDWNAMIRERKLEEIRVYLNKFFPNIDHTKEDVLNLVIESFYSNYFEQIMEAQKNDS